VTDISLTCQAILFDLDGVLVDSRAVVERTWARWAVRHGLHRPDLVRVAHGRRSIETVRDVAPHLDARAEVAWLESAELNDTAGLVAPAGAMALYAAVPDSRRAIVTSGGRSLAAMRLEAAGFARPGVLVAAEDVLTGKPAPDGYVLAAAKLSAEPRECLVIEDTPAGIAAGRAAGAGVIAVATTFPSSELSEASVSVDSLETLALSVEGDFLRIRVAT
jgi:sugar-phosphatase